MRKKTTPVGRHRRAIKRKQGQQLIKLEINAQVRKRNIHKATTRAVCQSCIAILSANNAACPVTLVVKTENPRKPAAFTNPAVRQSKVANFTLCP